MNVIPAYKEDAARRLKVAAGHLDAIRRMVDEERYCIDIMKQIAAVQASLEQVQQVVLKNHLSTCVTNAIHAGSGESIIDELVVALKYSKGVIQSTGDALVSCDRAEGDAHHGC